MTGVRLIVAVSELVRQDILARYGRHDPRVEVVWPWVDRAASGASGEVPRGDRSPPRWGFLAHNFALKGLDVLLQAMSLPGAGTGSLRVAVGARLRRVAFLSVLFVAMA